jgi:hypothetical protein
MVPQILLRPPAVHPICYMDSDSSFARSSQPSRECNILHLTGAGVVAEEGEEDGPVPIQRTPNERATYELERLERARACEVDLANERQDREFPSA